MPWFITVYKKYFLKNPFKSELSANSWKGERSNEKKNLKFMKVRPFFKGVGIKYEWSQKCVTKFLHWKVVFSVHCW